MAVRKTKNIGTIKNGFLILDSRHYKNAVLRHGRVEDS